MEREGGAGSGLNAVTSVLKRGGLKGHVTHGGYTELAVGTGAR
jgi:hypothetical protein